MPLLPSLAKEDLAHKRPRWITSCCAALLVWPLKGQLEAKEAEIHEMMEVLLYANQQQMKAQLEITRTSRIAARLQGRPGLLDESHTPPCSPPHP